jgi:hypothetical protein
LEGDCFKYSSLRIDKFVFAYFRSAFVSVYKNEFRSPGIKLAGIHEEVGGGEGKKKGIADVVLVVLYLCKVQFVKATRATTTTTTTATIIYTTTDCLAFSL